MRDAGQLATGVRQPGRMFLLAVEVARRRVVRDGVGEALLPPLQIAEALQSMGDAECAAFLPAHAGGLLVMASRAPGMPCLLLDTAETLERVRESRPRPFGVIDVYRIRISPLGGGNPPHP